MDSKRRRQDEGECDHVSKRHQGEREDEGRRSEQVLYLVKNKLTTKHYNHLKSLASKNGISISETFNNDVTHIVTVLPNLHRVKEVLGKSDFGSADIVTLDWLTACFIEGKCVQVTDQYRVKEVRTEAVQTSEKKEPAANVAEITAYECQRPTLLEHHNPHITEALELLEKYYQFLDHKQGDTRALAFGQASCTIKTLPKRVTRVEEVRNLHRIGKHSISVIEDIVLHGTSEEVEDIRQSDWFKCMELFTSVYGCGPATADKWYKKGFRTIDEIKTSETLELTELQKLGLLYYEDLSKSIPRDEVEIIIEIIKKEVRECCPEAEVEAVGGYRRGKSHSHDVDLLLTHKDSSVTATLLETVVSHLKAKDMLVHSNVYVGQNTLSRVNETHESSAQPTYTSEGQQIKRVQFDHLDKAFCIMKLTGSYDKTPLIRRVDLIVTPPGQFPFSLVSWTGSKQFNRSLRRYSVKECSKTVTAHGIFDIIQRKFLTAKTERDIFDILKLNYLEPWERNC